MVHPEKPQKIKWRNTSQGHRHIHVAQCSSVSSYPSYAQTSWFSYQHSYVPQWGTVVSFWSRISHIIGACRLSLVSIPMHHDAASTLLLCLKVFYSKFTQIFYLFILECIASHCYKRFRETPSVSSKYIVWAFFLSPDSNITKLASQWGCELVWVLKSFRLSHPPELYQFWTAEDALSLCSAGQRCHDCASRKTS